MSRFILLFHFFQWSMTFIWINFKITAELGDFDAERHPPGYISEFRFMANQSSTLEGEIAEKHKQLV